VAQGFGNVTAFLALSPVKSLENLFVTRGIADFAGIFTKRVIRVQNISTVTTALSSQGYFRGRAKY
jgi:hypothetical protein